MPALVVSALVEIPLPVGVDTELVSLTAGREVLAFQGHHVDGVIRYTTDGSAATATHGFAMYPGDPPVSAFTSGAAGGNTFDDDVRAFYSSNAQSSCFVTVQEMV